MHPHKTSTKLDDEWPIFPRSQVNDSPIRMIHPVWLVWDLKSFQPRQLNSKFDDEWPWPIFQVHRQLAVWFSNCSSSLMECVTQWHPDFGPSGSSPWWPPLFSCSNPIYLTESSPIISSTAQWVPPCLPLLLLHVHDQSSIGRIRIIQTHLVIYLFDGLMANIWIF